VTVSSHRRREVIHLVKSDSECEEIEGEFVDEQSYDNQDKLVDTVEMEREIRADYAVGLVALKERMEAARGMTEANLTRR